jgi:hypothetical protein
LFEDGIVTEFNLIAWWFSMKRVGVCVINLFFARANVLLIKTIPATNTACDRYLPEHSITESTQTSYILLKQLYPEPFVVLYRVDGLPARRIGDYICPKSAVLMTRDCYNLGGSFASSAVRRSPTRNKETDIRFLLNFSLG